MNRARSVLKGRSRDSPFKITFYFRSLRTPKYPLHIIIQPLETLSVAQVEKLLMQGCIFSLKIIIFSFRSCWIGGNEWFLGEIQKICCLITNFLFVFSNSFLFIPRKGGDIWVSELIYSIHTPLNHFVSNIRIELPKLKRMSNYGQLFEILNKLFEN